MATSAYITQQYQELLGRAPDAGGLQHYMGYSDPNAVRSSILGSDEYRTRASAPAPKSAQQIYDERVASDNQARQTLLDNQNRQQQGLFDQYSQKITGQEALPALYSRLQNEAGIPGLSQAAQGYKNEIYRVKDRLDRLGEDVTARTTGYNVSDAQRRRLEAAEANPIETNLARLGTGLAPIADMLTSAQSGVQNQIGLYAEQQNKELKPLEMQINSLSDRFAREITGFQQGHEDTLTNLLNKLQREQQLSDREWEAAQQLAAEERSFARQKSLAATQLSANYSGGGSTATPAPAKPSLDYNSYLGLGSSGGLSIMNSNSGGLGVNLNGYTGASKPAPSNAIPLFNQSISSAGNPLGLRVR